MGGIDISFTSQFEKEEDENCEVSCLLQGKGVWSGGVRGSGVGEGEEEEMGENIILTSVPLSSQFFSLSFVAILSPQIRHLLIAHQEHVSICM